MRSERATKRSFSPFWIGPKPESKGWNRLYAPRKKSARSSLGNGGKTPGEYGLFACPDAGESDSSYV
jgi:hypothetical protein